MKLAALVLALTPLACGTPRSETRPVVADSALEAGLAKVTTGDEAGAIEDFTRAIVTDPSNASAYRWRGHCFNFIGDYAAAIGDYDRAIELEPANAWSRYARAMSWHNSKDYYAALPGYLRAVALDPGFVKAWNWGGFTRKLIGDFEGAAVDLEQSLKLAPDDPWALMELANVRLALGNLQACERALSRVAELEPANASVRAQLGFLAAIRGSVAESLEHLAAAVAADAPEESHARIWILMQQADREAADRELRTWFDDARIDDAWEQQLLSFLLGQDSDELLIARAQNETHVRVAHGQPPDFLACEARFYAGLRHELRGESREARARYEQAMSMGEAVEAWEWHMARVRAESIPR